MPLDLASRRILFVAAASNAIGFGHLSRCLALAAYAHNQHADVNFLVFGSMAAAERINTAGFGCTLLDEAAMNGADWPQAGGLQSDVVIADLLFPAFASSCRDPERLFRRLRGFGRYLVALDVLGDFTIVDQLCRIEADLVVIPYAAPAVLAGKAHWRLLEGTRYALLSPEYAGLPPRQPRWPASRVLVSCGGSDPNGYTAEVLRGLEGVGRSLEVIVVLGPLFSVALRNELGDLAAVSRHTVQFSDAPCSLLELMLWCDFAISASGLTKYELAASGTPALLFSIDDFHDAVNQFFVATGAAVDMGVGVSVNVVANESERLLNDCALRRELAATGRKLVDGLGCQRLFMEIMKESCLAKK